MDVLYFLKLLRPKELNHDADFVNAKSSFSVDYPEQEEDDEEEEDSFFELELAVNGGCGDFKPKIEPKQSLPKRKILPFEQPISSPSKPNQSPVSRFRILAFKKSKSMPAQETDDTASSKSVKLNLSRNNSLRKQIWNDAAAEEEDTASSRRFPKEIVHKYLKLINPLIVKVKRSECERMKFAGEFSSYSSATSSPVTGSPTKKEKQGNGISIHAGIREVCKHLRKSKSAGASQPPPSAAAGQRRDDSLLLQADGIQSAILHCKRSFNSSRDSSLLSRFASEPLPERMSMDSPRVSNDEFGWN
ncbi:Probable membrane-associated kinase regulator 2 [Linum grandiflorum]